MTRKRIWTTYWALSQGQVCLVEADIVVKNGKTKAVVPGSTVVIRDNQIFRHKSEAMEAARAMKAARLRFLRQQLTLTERLPF